MNRFTRWMTAKELGELTGYTAQTISGWARKYGWKRISLKGRKGGAQLILITQQVYDYFLSTDKLRYSAHLYSRVEENDAPYVTWDNEMMAQFIRTLEMLTPDEQARLSELINEEGTDGLVKRLGLSDEK
ncbi:putative DNA-binding transcriptional regulator [Cronobacter universalis]|uniref:Negative regulator n=1 Tax=Cronobacter universalis NCTC 9529 TaxID=1074000 RepID=A0AAC9EWF3_9ENTR|nr:YfeC-like transcriptional regulator [Cronobacter universalis]ALB55748.1 negative regulator [Cronobacter universalis NCTC 9529]ELY3760096.1 putative DNA-binding transcriptional regulator [Cronobacter universalis]ELY6246992.1 putative DNA-binding transcriptional regulator [Cronobacter universalis]ELY7391893.1 putative DNA-binding transcriptional regulator [Cronobacter universalis]MDI7661365.1 putative DNA-binding transcriptional regulator [Cronobacter universalis]